jgi:hypothetical protein
MMVSYSTGVNRPSVPTEVLGVGLPRQDEIFALSPGHTWIQRVHSPRPTVKARWQLHLPRLLRWGSAVPIDRGVLLRVAGHPAPEPQSAHTNRTGQQERDGLAGVAPGPGPG